MNIITSRHNERVKRLRKLLQRNHRETEGRFLIEGAHLVGEALAAGWTVELLVYTPEAAAKKPVAALMEQARSRGIELLAVTEQVLAALTTTVTPQGTVALVRRPPDRHPQDVLPPADTKPLVLVLDGLQDPGNLGTILRTADAAGVDAVLVSAGTADLYAPKTVRAAAGSLFHIAVAEPVDAAECAALLKAVGLTILIADPRGGTAVFYQELDQAVALVIGNEGAGVGPALRAAADGFVHIPMPGRAESLNAAVAASLIVYEAVRQRLKAPCV